MQPPPIHYQPGWRGAINLAAWKNSRRLWEAVQANSGRRYKPCRRLTRFTFTLRLEIFREREKKKTEKEKKIHRSESQTFRTSTRLFYQPKWVTEREFSFWPWSRFSIFFRLSSSSWSIQKKKIHPWKFSTYVQIYFLRGSDYTDTFNTSYYWTFYSTFFFVIPPFTYM